MATLAEARLAALLASSERAAARRDERAWMDACSAYREARERARTSAILHTVQGLRFAIPQETVPRGLSARLREGWLPWHDVVNRWGLGLGGIAIDIGANVGTTAILRVLTGAARRVYAIEPDVDNYACLVQSIGANGLDGFVLPDSVAISDVTGTGAWRRADKMGNHHLVAESTPGSRQKTVPVPTMTLDDWIRAYGIAPEDVSFVKLDVQGWESRVLAGAQRLLACSHIVWALEVSPKHLDLAGTPLSLLLEQIARHFTHAIDARSKGGAISTRAPGALTQLLSHVGPGATESYTNLLLYNAGPSRS